jgi:mannose-6-phosphate isomerase-like protein (cupin superfamily)
MTSEPFIVDPSSGISVPLGPSRLTIKLGGAMTGGRFALLDYEVAPHFAAPTVPHWHTRESQTVYILRGRIRFEFATRVVDAETGTILHIPEGSGFTWHNPEPAPARMLYIFAPADFEQFFEDVQQIYTEHPGLMPSDAAVHVAKLWDQYGIET